MWQNVKLEFIGNGNVFDEIAWNLFYFLFFEMILTGGKLLPKTQFNDATNYWNLWNMGEWLKKRGFCESKRILIDFDLFNHNSIHRNYIYILVYAQTHEREYKHTIRTYTRAQKRNVLTKHINKHTQEKILPPIQYLRFIVQCTCILEIDVLIFMMRRKIDWIKYRSIVFKFNQNTLHAFHLYNYN